MTDYDELIALLLKERSDKRNVSFKVAQDVNRFAAALELHLGAPEGAIRITDKNGVWGDDAQIVDDATSSVEFFVVLTVEHDMDVLGTSRVRVTRSTSQAGDVYCAGEREHACLDITDAEFVESVSVLLRNQLLG